MASFLALSGSYSPLWLPLSLRTAANRTFPGIFLEILREGATTDRDGLYHGQAGYKNHIKKDEAQVKKRDSWGCVQQPLKYVHTTCSRTHEESARNVGMLLVSRKRHGGDFTALPHQALLLLLHSFGAPPPSDNFRLEGFPGRRDQHFSAEGGLVHYATAVCYGVCQFQLVLMQSAGAVLWFSLRMCLSWKGLFNRTRFQHMYVT